MKDVFMPKRVAKLPRDDKGRPVPWFVASINGKPDFRVADGPKLIEAVRYKKCWVCGEPLGRFMSFVAGPMCAVNRTSADPPSHKDCAIFSAQACPFLSTPEMDRRRAGYPAEATEAAGIMIKRNPGVTLIWTVTSYQVMRLENGILFRFPDPVDLLWYAEGRAATQAEVLAALASGLPILQEEAQQDGPAAIKELDAMFTKTLALVPRE